MVRSMDLTPLLESSDEDPARFHPGGVGAVCRPSHHPSRLVSQEAAGVHHARTEPALPSLGLKLTEGPGYAAEAGRAGGKDVC